MLKYFHLVDGVVDVDAVVLVGEVPLQLVAAVLVHTQLVVHLLQGLLHPRLTLPSLSSLLSLLSLLSLISLLSILHHHHAHLALPDLVHLPMQRPLHSVAHQVYLLPPLPGVVALQQVRAPSAPLPGYLL